jgi:O-antigen/teichoic acid export membrane protein
MFSPILSGFLFYLSQSVNKSRSVYYGYISACMQILSIVLILFLVFGLLIIGDFGLMHKIGLGDIFNKKEILLGSVNVILIFTSNLLDQILLANKKNLFFSGIQLISSSLKIIGMCLVFLLFGKVDLITINLLLIIVCILIIGIQMVAILRDPISRVNISSVDFKQKRFMRKVVRYSLLPIIWGPFQFLFFFVDRYAIISFGSLAELGNYAALFQIGFTPIYLFLSIVSQYLAPEVYSRGGNIYKYTSKIVFKLTLLILPLAVLIFFSSDVIIYTLLSSHYLMPTSIFINLFLAGAFFSLGQIASVPLQSNNFPIQLFLPKASMALLACLLCLVLMRLFGVLGVSVAILISCIYYYLFVIILNWKKSKKYESKFYSTTY